MVELGTYPSWSGTPETLKRHLDERQSEQANQFDEAYVLDPLKEGEQNGQIQSESHCSYQLKKLREMVVNSDDEGNYSILNEFIDQIKRAERHFETVIDYAKRVEEEADTAFYDIVLGDAEIWYSEEFQIDVEQFVREDKDGAEINYEDELKFIANAYLEGVKSIKKVHSSIEKAKVNGLEFNLKNGEDSMENSEELVSGLQSSLKELHKNSLKSVSEMFDRLDYLYRSSSTDMTPAKFDENTMPETSEDFRETVRNISKERPPSNLLQVSTALENHSEKMRISTRLEQLAQKLEQK